MARAHTIGRTASNGDQVWIIGTPHFLEAWGENRYGKSRSVSLQEQLGSWTYPSKVGFYESMMDAPIDQTFYAVVRKRRGLKPIAFNRTIPSFISSSETATVFLYFSSRIDISQMNINVMYR